MTSYVFDIEADDLYDDVTKIHCLSYIPTSGGDPTTLFEPEDIEKFLDGAEYLIAHNCIRYDVPTIKKILGVTVKAKLCDTLALSWYLNFDRAKHGLESYGEDYGIPKPPVDNWKTITRAQAKHRCEEDTKINFRLWQDLMKKLMFLYKDKAEAERLIAYLGFKMQAAAHQELIGWHVDVEKAQECVDTLTQQQEEKTIELAKVMPPRKLYKTVSPPKKPFKKDGTPSEVGQRWFSLLDDLGLDRTHSDDVKVLKGEEEANPGSSDQVKDWLFGLGWDPCSFDYKKNDKGEERAIPQIRKDGDLTDSVKLLIDTNPAVEVLDGLTVIQHRLAIFKGFVECARDGKLKAEIAGLTNTLRFRHSKPLVNLPGVDKPWGKEIRGCLKAPPGGLLCGADMVSQESTVKRHFMYPHDPDYVAEMSKEGFDEHLDLAKFAGAVTEEQVQKHIAGEINLKSIRKNYKAANYSCIYGVGAPKLSRATGLPVYEAANLIKAYWERNWSVKKVSEEQKVRKIGGQMWLLNPISKFWYSLRSEKDIFSTLCQGTGSYVFDSWLAQCWIRGIKGIGQFHDEVIVPIEAGAQEETATLMQDSIDAVNNKLKLNVPLGVDPQFGTNYAQIH